MIVFTKIREIFLDTLGLKLEIEEIKKKLKNHNKSIELIFTYLDELLEKQKESKPRRLIGYKQIKDR